MKYKVLISEGEDGWYVVECPSIPGCVSQGKSLEEALENIKDAIQGSLDVLNEKPNKNEKFQKDYISCNVNFIYGEVTEIDDRCCNNKTPFKGTNSNSIRNAR